MNLRVLSFIDYMGNTILKTDLTSLPLKEERIISKSIELFNDREPCIIHRTYIMKKLFFEIEEFLDKTASQGNSEVLWEQIPGNILDVLDIRPKVHKLVIK